MEESLVNEIPPTRARRLRLYNLLMGGLHAVQGAAILALSNDFSLPVHATFMQGPPGDAPAELHALFDLPVGPAIAAFVFLSAAAHWLLVLPGVFEWYTANLGRGRNYARWIEYSLSASIMIVLIAMLTGIGDIAALVALFGVNASMMFFGLLQERYERPGDGSLLPFWLGCIAGAVPWIAIGIYVVSPGIEATPPAFVYGIFVSLFIFFDVFALNMWLQYRRIGPWRDYLFGESAYILLSLTAKSALAWQVFFPTLVG
ncbi:MAG: heliorhodopsin HeR [Dehalococcoidia bacterium]